MAAHARTLSPISRKRKAAGGKLVLDWDALLSDKEPPQLLVIEEPHKDLYLQGLSDKELADKISRAENMLGGNPSIFPDGGAKMRVVLNKQLAEIERRKLLKADGKCTKANQEADKPIHIDAIDDLTSRGAPPPVPASQSNFASRFCSKLEDKGPAKSFTIEMSTLNRCANKRENRPLVDRRTQKIGLSSRHAPFKFPSNLSDHTNDSSQPNREHFGSHSSTPLHRQPDKGVSGCFEKKKNARRVQPMRSCKLNNRPFVLIDDEELEVDGVNQASQSNLGDKVQLPTTSYPLNSLEDMGPILETMTISEQAQFGNALISRALDVFASARGGFLQLEAENKKLTELAQAERDSWLKEKEALIAAHKVELAVVKEKSRAEGYEQGQDELKGLQRPFMSNASSQSLRRND